MEDGERLLRVRRLPLRLGQVGRAAAGEEEELPLREDQAQGVRP